MRAQAIGRGSWRGAWAWRVGAVWVAILAWGWTCSRAETAEDAANAPQAESAPAHKAERLTRFRQIYEFEKWGGKVKRPGFVAALNLREEMFDGQGKARVLMPQDNRSDRFGILLLGDEKTANAVVSVSRFDAPLAAHESLMEYFTFCCTAPPPVFTRVTDGPAAEIGDVCFVPTGKWRPAEGRDAVLATLLFTRNNVYVRLDQRQGGKERYHDLVDLARRIDERLLEALTPEEPKPPDAKTPSSPSATDQPPAAPPAPAETVPEKK